MRSHFSIMTYTSQQSERQSEPAEKSETLDYTTPEGRDAIDKRIHDRTIEWAERARYTMLETQMLDEE